MKHLSREWEAAVRTEGTPERAAAIAYLEARERKLREEDGIQGLRRHDRGYDPNNRHNRLPRFSHLPPETRELAEQLLAKYIERNKHKWSLPTWNKIYASLVAVASQHAQFKIAHFPRGHWRYYWLKGRYAKKLKVLLGLADRSPCGIAMTENNKNRRSEYKKYKEYEEYPKYAG